MVTVKNYSDRKYTIEKYNPAWKSQFEKEADIIRNILGTSATSIEHVGSTAVPNLSGKPTIDVLVVVNSIEEIEKFIPSMIQAGYLDKGEYITTNTRLLAREKDNERLVNVHIFPKGTTRIEQMLAVRDFLRTHPDKVEEYNQLKQELYLKYPHDYGMYRKHKDEWMKKLIQSVCLPVSFTHMYFKSPKTLLLISGITSIVCSRVLFALFDDPEGPNLLIVIVMAAIIYVLSVAIYSFYFSTKPNNLKTLVVQILIQILIGGAFYLGLS